MNERLIRLALALCAAFLLAPVLAEVRDALQEAPAASTGVDLLLIEHTDAGVIEHSGHVAHWRYAADSSAHAVLCVDYTPDGDLVMRDTFDEKVPSCQ